MSSVKVVELTPDKELAFNFGLLTQSEQKLKITNVTSDSVAFKVKTTAPKAYLVRPSNDVLPPRASVDVMILLQPNQGGKSDTPHRFLVQAAALEKGRTTNLAKDEWNGLAKESIQEARLSVAPIEVAGGDSVGGDNLQDKYDKLVKYTVDLEKETLKLQGERDEMQRRIEARTSEFAFELWHLLLAMALAVFLLKLPSML